MKKLQVMLRDVGSRGFTMIELLIVIAIIGILAAALMAALDPIEQLRKSRDTAKMADAREMLGSFQRFYASKGCFPHNFTPPSTCAALSVVAPTLSNVALTTTVWLNTLVTNGELKSTFVNKNSINNGWLQMGIAADGTMSVCFPAESKNARSGSLGGGLYQFDAAAVITAATPAQIASCIAATLYNPTTNVAGCMVCVQ